MTFAKSVPFFVRGEIGEPVNVELTLEGDSPLVLAAEVRNRKGFHHGLAFKMVTATQRKAGLPDLFTFGMIVQDVVRSSSCLARPSLASVFDGSTNADSQFCKISFDLAAILRPNEARPRHVAVRFPRGDRGTA